MIIKNSLTDIKQGEKRSMQFSIQENKIFVQSRSWGDCWYFKSDHRCLCLFSDWKYNWTWIKNQLFITRSGTVSISISRDQTVCKSKFEINSKPSFHFILLLAIILSSFSHYQLGQKMHRNWHLNIFIGMSFVVKK